MQRIRVDLKPAGASVGRGGQEPGMLLPSRIGPGRKQVRAVEIPLPSPVLVVRRIRLKASSSTAKYQKRPIIVAADCFEVGQHVGGKRRCARDCVVQAEELDRGAARVREQPLLIWTRGEVVEDREGCLARNALDHQIEIMRVAPPRVVADIEKAWTPNGAVERNPVTPNDVGDLANTISQPDSGTGNSRIEQDVPGSTGADGEHSPVFGFQEEPRVAFHPVQRRSRTDRVTAYEL